ncbi:nucleic acid/nucleotide deaminase domain-containing protein [Streptomyces sp. V4I2]|uniref:nucleic acid/nucleotide deaminase domain-containing protein n=1 Tax=Streptomyces sp. V4I2 TaxID=3042280 RepID=UPI0027D81F14|nr:nucleic acid/nucleotide deaminase domain-containing protein [Streptomyces sp. V4I2]
MTRGAAAVIGLVLVLLLGVPQSTATPVAQAQVVEATPKPCGKARTKLTSWFQTPIGRRAYVARAARYIDDPEKAWRNLAMGFIDITNLDGLNTKGLEVVDVTELQESDPELHRQLCLDENPEIKRFIIIRKTNNAHAEHSEIRLLEELDYLGVKDQNRLFAVYTDRSPCPRCAPEIPKNARVYYAVPHGTRSTAAMRRLLTATAPATEKNAAFRQEVAQEKERLEQREEVTEERRREKARQTSRVFRTARGGGSCSLGLASAALTSAVRSACGESDAAGGAESGLVRALAAPVEQALGGIDFSALQLRYLSDPGDGSGLQYSFQAPASTTGGTSPDLGVDAARLTSDAFFTWLALDPSTYWVNLNPNEPDRIVDSRLGRTDVGRVMLQADLRLKKDTSRILHPDTASGREFWDGLLGTCTRTRVWIVPAPAQVRRDDDRLYILDAPLDVRMKSQYRSRPAESCPGNDVATENHNERLIQRLVLPRLKKDVNSGPGYADLRRVYLARVAAEWYRDLSRSQQTTYGDLVDRGDIGPWTTRTGWTADDTYDAYVDSYTNHEFDIVREWTENGVRYRRSYVSGGVNLRDVPLRQMSDGSFESRYGDLREDVDKSLRQPSPGDASGTLSLGSPTPRQAAGLGPPGDGSSPWDLTLRLLPFAAAVLLLPLAVLLLRRWRRRPLSTPAAVSPLRQAALRSARTRPRPSPQGDNHDVRGREGPGP